MSAERNLTDDLGALLAILPPAIADHLRRLSDSDALLEVVMDLGRVPEARLPEGGVDLGDGPVTRSDLDHVIARVGTFSGDNRAGIEATLHRISAIRNRQGAIVGLTCRVGRSVLGTIDVIRDLIESGRSLLVLGPPGSGKTTKLREAARVLATDFKKRVVVIEDMIAIRPMVYLSLTFDHRVVDGFTADGFLAKVVEALESW